MFEDPLALSIIDPAVAAQLRASPESFDTSRIGKYLRAALAVRSRFAEDELRAAYDSGVRQYVVLGAGFDTFAYRNPFPDLRVYEVDHPATQSAKRTRLIESEIAIPASMTFVAVDFARMSLAERLAASGFDIQRAAFFSWLGVIPYLERAAIEDTLRYVASLPRGTAIVFDYGIPPSSLSFIGGLVFKRLAKRVAAIGEPWKTFFDPAELRAILLRTGFSAVDDFGPADLNARYFAGRTDGLRIGEMAHIAKSTV